jgi:hypothetical protein
VSAEVADGSCACVGPDAAADSDVFEDVDALVCESLEGSVLCTVVVQILMRRLTCLHSVWEARPPLLHTWQ